ncbi:Isopentenyl phosphate kinase [Trichoplax sp. H2]|nr:Isopentenyl phosphate kinase [Trichoplax sp. H2]|eukprot:RDD44967.1 Isopentenyl phosphate kinase [Trichoplax sp. H2]
MALENRHVDCIIKLGGSAITSKQHLEKANTQAINIAASHVHEMTRKCVIVHGAGSFGHFHAKKYNIATGFNDTDFEQQRIGFSQTRLSVTKLNHIIVQALIEKDIPAVSISPCGLWKTTDRSVTSTFLQPINDLLRAGFVPVVHGDAVIDTSLGCTILSGDTIIQLNHIIVQALIEKDVPAVSISPCGLWKTTDRSVTSTFLQPINDLLRAGFVPVVHGDAVIDTSLGCTILSGDTIIQILAENLCPKRIIFITDTNGIYDRPPHNDDAKLLRYISVTKDGKVTNEIETSQLEHDVTGGVQTKIASAAHIVSKCNIPVHVVKLGSAAAWKLLDKVELEESDIATTITLQESEYPK